MAYIPEQNTDDYYALYYEYIYYIRGYPLRIRVVRV